VQSVGSLPFTAFFLCSLYYCYDREINLKFKGGAGFKGVPYFYFIQNIVFFYKAKIKIRYIFVSSGLSGTRKGGREPTDCTILGGSYNTHK